MPDPTPTYRRSFAKRVWYGLVAWGLTIAFLLYNRIRWEGARRVPTTGPVVLLANHTSHLDPPMIGALCPRQIGYLAKKTLFTGLLGPLIRSLDAIPIDQEGSGIAGIKATLKRLKQGDAILVFPEGQRTLDGKLKKLEPGFLALVRRSGATIAPVGISGAHQSMPPGTLLPRPARCAVSFGEPLPREQTAELSDEALLELAAERILACCQRADELAGRGGNAG